MATAMLVALTTGCGGKAGSAKSGKDITAEFTDANFLAAARTALGKEATDNICDTDDFASVASLDLSGKGIASLAGIERFTALTELDCSMNRLTALPALPSGLTRLNCSVNQLTSLPALPSGLTELDCYTNQLASLPKLPSGLKQLSCSNNKLVSLPSLPSGMTSLGCSDNRLTSLPALPSGMGELYCPDNQLTSLHRAAVRHDKAYLLRQPTDRAAPVAVDAEISRLFPEQADGRRAEQRRSMGPS